MNNSDVLCPVMLKFDKLVHYGTLEVAELFKSTSSQIQEADSPDFQSIFRCKL